MAKVWEILHQEHPEHLTALIMWQSAMYGTKLDFLIIEQQTFITVAASFPSLEQIGKTIREKPKQERGKGW